MKYFFLLFLLLGLLCSGSVTTNMLQVVARKSVVSGGGGIVEDAQATTSGIGVTSLHIDLTQGSLTAGYAVVLFQVNHWGAWTISNCDYGTDASEAAMTLIQSLTWNGDFILYIYGIDLGTSGSGAKDLEIGFSTEISEAAAVLITYSGVAQGVGAGWTKGTDSQYGTTPAVTLTKPDGDIMLAVHGNTGAVLTVNDTEEWNYPGSDFDMAANSIFTGSGSQTCDASFSGSDWWGSVGAVLQAD